MANFRKISYADFKFSSYFLFINTPGTDDPDKLNSAGNRKIT